jgi:hypothetical protein
MQPALRFAVPDHQMRSRYLQNCVHCEGYQIAVTVCLVRRLAEFVLCAWACKSYEHNIMAAIAKYDHFFAP